MRNLTNILLLLLLSSLASVISSQSNETVTYQLGGQSVTQSIYYYTQILDHFNPNDQRVWQQRYSVYDQYFNPSNGTVFIYIGAESAQKGIYSGWIIELCKKFSAMAIAVEHRFYGESQPFGKNGNSYSTQNLQYLSADLALEDLAQMIATFKELQMHGVSELNPFITIGGSYGGSLSAWFRSKYPHLVNGALASSAVIVAIEDFQQYDHQIYKSAALSGEWCPQNIQKFNNKIENESTTLTFARWAFNATYLISNDEFLFYLSEVQASFIQYGSRKQLCQIFAQNTTFAQQLKELSTYAKSYLPIKGYSAFTLKNSTYEEYNMMRQWTWQQCTQFGWFAAANQIQPMKSKKIDVNYFKQNCKNIFGEIYGNPDINAINARFGADKIGGTNIVFTNGSEDIWKWASLLKSTPKLESLISECDSCGHCVEFAQPEENDSQSLKDTRFKVEQLFSQWINNHYNKKTSKNRFLRNRN